MNTRRIAAIHRERAEILARLVQLDEELAAAFVEGDDAEQPAREHKTPRSRPVRQTQIVVPERRPGREPPSELDQARARAALRRVGYRTR